MAHPTLVDGPWRQRSPGTRPLQRRRRRGPPDPRRLRHGGARPPAPGTGARRRGGLRAVAPGSGRRMLDTLFAAVVDLLAQHRLGGGSHDALLDALPGLARHVVDEPRRVVGSLANAVVHLHAHGIATDELAPACHRRGRHRRPTATLRAGQVAAWRAGSATSATVPSTWRRRLGADVLGAALGAGGPVPVDETVKRLHADPWWRPGRPPAGEPVVAHGRRLPGVRRPVPRAAAGAVDATVTSWSWPASTPGCCTPTPSGPPSPAPTRTASASAGAGAGNVPAGLRPASAAAVGDLAALTVPPAIRCSWWSRDGDGDAWTTWRRGGSGVARRAGVVEPVHPAARAVAVPDAGGGAAGGARRELRHDPAHRPAGRDRPAADRRAGLERLPVEILAHEIGHHILCPATLTDHGRMLARMRWALPTRRARRRRRWPTSTPTSSSTTGCSAARGCGMAEVYRRLRAGASDGPGNDLWRLYQRMYEILWACRAATSSPDRCPTASRATPTSAAGWCAPTGPTG